LWLAASDIRDFVCTVNLFIWVYDPGSRMEYICAEKVSLSRVRSLDQLDHVLIHRKMFRKFRYPSSNAVSPLLSALSNQIETFLRTHLSMMESSDVLVSAPSI